MTDLPAPYIEVDLDLPDRRDGKVRASFAWGDDRLFVTTDRLSAFDRIIAGVPYKGQVLNQLAAWWFARTADLVANHVVAVPDPNVLIARSAVPLPVEVVVRGVITGVTVDVDLADVRRRGSAPSTGTRCPTACARTSACPRRSSRRRPRPRTAATTSR